MNNGALYVKKQTMENYIELTNNGNLTMEILDNREEHRHLWLEMGLEPISSGLQTQWPLGYTPSTLSTELFSP